MLIKLTPNIKNKTFYSLFINSVWLLFDKIFQIINALLIGALVIRHLGPSNYGVISYSIAYVAVFQNISQLGLGSIIIKKINQNVICPSVILGSALYIRIFTSLTTFITICVINKDNTENYVLVFIAAGLLFNPSELISLWFQSQLKNKKIVLASNSITIISSLIKFYYIFNNKSLDSFAFLILLESILTLCIFYFFYIKNKTPKKWEFNKNVALVLLKEAFPLFISGIGIIILSKNAQILINHYIDSKSVAFYSIAQMICDHSYVLPMALHSSIFPFLQNKKVENNDHYIFLYKKIISISFLFAIFIALLIAFLSKYIILLLFGQSYYQSILILSILIFNLIPVTVGIIQSIWLNLENKNIIVLIQTLIGGFLAIGLNYFFIPKFGIIGAASVTLISQFFNVFIITFLLIPELTNLHIVAITDIFRSVYIKYFKII
jgi:PST family polysaccharide transporter